MTTLVRSRSTDEAKDDVACAHPKQLRADAQRNPTELRFDPCDHATTALLEELVDFFPRARRRLLAKALGKLKTLEARALELADSLGVAFLGVRKGTGDLGPGRISMSHAMKEIVALREDLYGDQ